MERRSYLQYCSAGIVVGTAGCSLLSSPESGAHFDIRNLTDSEKIVQIVVKTRNDSVIYENTFTVGPGWKETDDVIDEGRFEVTVNVDGYGTKSHSLQVGCPAVSFYIRIEEDGDLLLSQSYCE